MNAMTSRCLIVWTITAAALAAIPGCWVPTEAFDTHKADVDARFSKERKATMADVTNATTDLHKDMDALNTGFDWISDDFAHVADESSRIAAENDVLKGKVASNAAALKALTATVETEQKRLGTVEATAKGNGQQLANIQTKLLPALDARVTANKTAADGNATEIKTIRQELKDLKAQVEGMDLRLTQKIADLDARLAKALDAESEARKAEDAALAKKIDTGLAAADARIVKNTGDITKNTTDIGTNKTAVTANAAEIATNTGNIGANKNAIGVNTGAIGNNGTAIAANKTDIGTNTGNIGKNNTAIAVNTAAIGTIMKTIASTDGRMLKLLKIQFRSMDDLNHIIKQIIKEMEDKPDSGTTSPPPPAPGTGVGTSPGAAAGSSS